MDVAVDHQAFDLVEHRRVGGVAVRAIGAARHDDADRRLLAAGDPGAAAARWPAAWCGSAPGWCGCAAACARRSRPRLQEEGVVHLPRRVLGREVQRREVVEVVLDVRAFGHARSPSRRRWRSSRPSPAWSDGREPLRRGGGGQGEVDALGGQLGVQLGGLQRGLALGDGGGDAVAQAVDLRALARGARPGSSRPATSAGRRSSRTCRARRRARLPGRRGRRRRRCAAVRSASSLERSVMDGCL